MLLYDCWRVKKDIHRHRRTFDVDQCRSKPEPELEERGKERERERGERASDSTQNIWPARQ